MCVWLFAVVALELKYRAPHAHTMLECVEVRWGTAAHIVSAPDPDPELLLAAAQAQSLCSM